MTPGTLSTHASTALPHPHYLWGRLTESPHFHLGYFLDASEPMALAFDRLVEECDASLLPRSRVLDVGCGLGGSSAWLAARGHDVCGVDPAAALIGYARSHAPAVEWVVGKLATLTGSERFEAAVWIEVLQHLDLLAALDSTRELLVSGGVLVVADVATVSEHAWSAVPFHRVGVLVDTAERSDFEVAERRDVTEFTRPSFPRMLEWIAAQRPTLIAELASSRPAVAADLDELVVQLQHLDEGFASGELRYEITALRRR